MSLVLNESYFMTQIENEQLKAYLQSADYEYRPCVFSTLNPGIHGPPWTGPDRLVRGSLPKSVSFNEVTNSGSDPLTQV